MRLDIGEMQAPWLPVRFRSRDEFHGAPGHVGCFGIFFRDAGRLVGMDQ